MNVLDIFQKKRVIQPAQLEKYLQGAREYLHQTYIASQPKPSNIQSSRCPSDERIRYSHRDLTEETSEAPIVMWQGDLYKHDAIKQLFSSHFQSSAQLSAALNAHLNQTFVASVAQYIRTKGWRDAQVYKAAQIDRRLFSKIMSDREYKPSKDTALALAIALELTLQQTNDLLDRAGYTLSHSNKRDVIIEYMISQSVHELADINEVLFKLGQKTIGR